MKTGPYIEKDQNGFLKLGFSWIDKNKDHRTVESVLIMPSCPYYMADVFRSYSDTIKERNKSKKPVREK